MLITLKYFAKNLNFLRKEKGLKQHMIAGFEPSAWSNYERGKSFPSLEDFTKISIFFGVNEHDILYKDLSKGGDYSKPSKDIKKQKKDDFKGDYHGDYKTKNHQNSSLPMSVNEPGAEYPVTLRMPQVVTVDHQGNENIILVPVRARAGYLNGYADPEFIAQLPSYRLPGMNTGTFRMFEVSGQSMYDTLHDHDLVIGSYVEQLRDTRDDRVHVIVTKNDGVVIKRVLNRIDKEGKLILKSDNYKDRDLWPTIVCDQQDVLEVWYVIANLTRQLKGPGELYKKTIDLDGRLTLIEDLLKKRTKK